MYNNQFGYNPYYQAPRFNQPIEQPIQQPTQQPIVNNNMPVRQFLNGKLVDSIEVVKATEANLDGSISYYPLTDNSAIVTKKLLPDGTSKTTIYKPVEEKEIPKIEYVTKEDLKKSVKEVDMSEVIDDLKDEIKDLKAQIKKMKKGD